MKVHTMESLVGESNMSEVLEPCGGWLSSWFPWLRWTPTSAREVKEAEERLLAHCQIQSQGFYVNVGKVGGRECRVWTRRFGQPEDGAARAPLVLVHGMGAGLAMFVLNLDSLASQGRLVYAIDLPGFGRSSRVRFSPEPEKIEAEYVECLEQWRQRLGLGRIHLLGHSFGGYLTALYSLKYPDSLQTATLADPWGMTPRLEDTAAQPQGAQRRQVPGWVRALAKVLANFNPLWGLRAAGPAGPWLVARTRPDIMRKYEALLGPGSRLVSSYIFHCNGHTPTGETAFHSLMSGFGWANNPILPRLHALNNNGIKMVQLVISSSLHYILPFSVRMKVLYGSNSWMTHLTQGDFSNAGVAASVDVEYIDNAGHHIYADQHQQFNHVINDFLKEND